MSNSFNSFPSPRKDSLTASMSSTTPPPAITVQETTVGYGDFTAVRGLSVEFPRGQFTCIIGPNGCGKSTLLRALARVLTTTAGTICLDGKEIGSFDRKELSRCIALMAQDASAPEHLTVTELVARGRFAHQGLLGQRSSQDWDKVSQALSTVELGKLADRRLSELSGGQRQRAWLAMALAQDTPVLLLDEPTTFLDLGYQHELLTLIASLNANEHKTVIAVVHDLQQAVRFADHLVALKDGQLVAHGKPTDVVTAELIKSLYGLSAEVTRAGARRHTVIVPD